MLSVVYKVSGANVSKYRVVRGPDGKHRVEKNNGLFLWQEIPMPSKYDAYDVEVAISWAKYRHACDIEEKAKRDRVVWKL